MKGLLVVLLLLVLSGAVGVIVTRVLARREIGTGAPHWQLSERRTGGRLVVELLPPGHHDGPPILVGALDPADPGFPQALDDARAEAVRQLLALNRPDDEPR